MTRDLKPNRIFKIKPFVIRFNVCLTIRSVCSRQLLKFLESLEVYITRILLFCISTVHMCVFLSLPNNQNTLLVLYRSKHLFVDTYSCKKFFWGKTWLFFFISHGHVVPNESSLSDGVQFLNQWNSQSAHSFNFACIIRLALGLGMF